MLVLPVCFTLGMGHCIGYRAAQGQSRQQAYNLYIKLILALNLTDTGGTVLTIMLGYGKFKTKTGALGTLRHQDTSAPGQFGTK